MNWDFQMADGYWEIAVLDQLQKIRNPLLDKVMGFLSLIGDAGLFWIVLALLFVCFSKKYKSMGWQMIWAMLLTFIVGNLILKNVFERPRPFGTDLFLINGAIPKDSSFPSGHTMNGFSAAVVILCNHRKIGIPAILFAGAIAFSRLYNYCHFPTDVLAGILIGTVIALFCTWWYRRYQNTIKFI